MVTVHPRRKAGRIGAGFSMMEALIALSLFSVILIMVLMIYDTNQQTYVRGEAEAELQQNIRVALGQMARDIHLAGYDPSNAINAQAVKYPFQPVSGAALSGTELRLLADMDQDGITDCVAYRMSGGRLMRRKTSWTSGACTWASTESEVAEYVSSLSFIYYPATGTTATTDPAVARRVRVQITGVHPTHNMAFTGTSEASLRQ